MHGWGLFFLLLLLLAIFAVVGWVAYSFHSRGKQGLPPPSLLSWRTYVPFLKATDSSSTNFPTARRTGPVEWLRDQIDRLRNRRTARGAYEESSLGGGDDGVAAAGGGYRPTAGGGARGGRGRGLEDDAWDTRVGVGDDEVAADAYRYSAYDEQGLSLAADHDDHDDDDDDGHGHYYHKQSSSTSAHPYGRSSDYAVGGDGRGRLGPDPFGDHNEADSLRSVSPRPHESSHTRGQASIGTSGSGDSSGEPGANSTRKSAFREDM